MGPSNLITMEISKQIPFPKTSFLKYYIIILFNCLIFIITFFDSLHFFYFPSPKKDQPSFQKGILIFGQSLFCKNGFSFFPSKSGNKQYESSHN